MNGRPVTLVALFSLCVVLTGCTDSAFTGATPSQSRSGGTQKIDPSPSCGCIETEVTPRPSPPPAQVPPPAQAPPPVQVPPPNTQQHGPMEVIFGITQAFHLGDGRFDQSSCLADMHVLPTAGIRYSFSFEVTEDDTRIDVRVGRICGVDYPDSNVIGIAGNAGSVSSQNLVPGGTNLALAPVSLGKGTYSVYIESNLGSAMAPSDRDDFIVGDVHVAADKAIRIGHVAAGD